MSGQESNDALDSAEGITFKFRDAFESERLFVLANDLMCIAGNDGFFKRVNPAFTRILGYSERELLNTPIVDFVHPDDRAATVTQLHNLGEGRPTVSFENRYRCKDGQIKTLWWNAVPIVEEGRILGIGRDVTGERETHRALRQANAVLEAVGKAQSLVIENQDSRILFDDLLQVLLQLTDSEFGFIGEVLHDDQDQPYLRTHAITDIAWDDASRKLYEENAPKGFEFRNLKTLFGRVMTSQAPVITNDPANDPRRGGIPKGHPVLQAFLGVPFLRSGEMIGMVGMANRPGGYEDAMLARLEPVLQACTSIVHSFQMDRKRRDQEDQLRESEERFNLAVTGSADGIWDWHILNDYVYYSPRFKELLGYEDHEMENRFSEFESRLHPDDRGPTLAAVQSHLNLRSPYDVEYRLITKAGEYRWFRARGQAVWNSDNQPTRMAGSITDIHEHNVAKEKLAEANARLHVLATTDALTGLANRPSFDNELERVWRLHLEERLTVSLLILDVDFFKQYNDSLGHLAGDECLKMVARIIQSSLNHPSDFAARYGGEEFAVILPGSDAVGAATVAARIIANVRAEGIPHPASRVDSVVTMSIGATATGGPRLTRLSDLVHEADKALYRAKSSGRNRFELELPDDLLRLYVS